MSKDSSELKHTREIAQYYQDSSKKLKRQLDVAEKNTRSLETEKCELEIKLHDKRNTITSLEDKVKELEEKIKYKGKCKGPFECQFCDLKDFKYREDVVAHQDKVHADKKPYACDYCSQKFHAKHMTSKHMKSVHGHVPPSQQLLTNPSLKGATWKKIHDRKRKISKKKELDTKLVL